MPYFTEQARTHGECLEKIKVKYGERAKVLTAQTIRRGGILGLGSHEEVEMTGTYTTYGYAVSPPAALSGGGITGGADLEAAKRGVLAAAGKTMPEAALQTVLKGINSLEGMVRGLSAKVDATMSAPPVQDRGEHPSLLKLEKDLAANDFSPSFTKGIAERVRREFPLDDLDEYEEVQRRVLRWIGETISLYREAEGTKDREAGKKPRVIILVGPTGVGKTTTIAKLAALYGERSEGRWQRSVRLVTLDNYRIGGRQQIEKYGEIMEIPVSAVENYEGLRQVMALYRQEVDYVLVDTIGKSPRNYGELGEMKAILDACPARSETHLCLSATTKSSDIREILKQFEPFMYQAVIITKMDETRKAGNVVSALAEEKKSVSFITTGQTVPSDIQEASVTRFLMKLEGFTVDRDALTSYFKENTGV
ncbi:MAG: flagellar biosynthesis protein FlhF [Treponema sp.]|jgi:flagellar biosynthesis protein FlhF|nr:flagellar biosynthesis protein FlhF [Treponema sp.]